MDIRLRRLAVKGLRWMIPPSRNGRILAIGGTVDSLGTGMFLAASTLYFVQVVGLPMVAVGAALGAGSVCGLLSPVPMGRLADRIGAGRVFVGLLVVRAFGYAGYALVDDYQAYFALTCLLAAADAASAPLFQAVIGDVVPAEQRSVTMASIRAIRNIGLSVGFLLAGGVQALNWAPAFQILFAVNGVSFIATGLAIRRATATVTAHKPAVEVMDHSAPDVPAPYRDRRFIGLVVANAFAMLHDSILFVLVPLWVVEVLDLPASLSSALLAVNTIQTALLQGYIGRSVQGLARSVRTIRWACGLLVLTCACFAAAAVAGTALAVTGAVAGVVILTVAENMLIAASWEMSYVVSPERKRAQYLAFFSLGFGSQRAVGPLLMTAVVLPSGGIGWALLGALFLLAAGGTTAAARPARAA
ncbi:MFS transporter [Streptomyces griseus]|uniref:MFS transporter n=1 Tax=Streptomyces griseus TaxID=1911 RepID=UPI003688D5B6